MSSQSKRKRSFLRRPKQSGEMALQITSMADVFVIILVFLLKSYATGTIEMQSKNGIRLPSVDKADAESKALQVEVSKDEVLVAGQPAAKIKDFAFSERELGANGVSAPLSAALGKEHAAGDPADPKTSRIIVIADSRAPYATIKTVLASAATQGYTDFKLAVHHEQ